MKIFILFSLIFLVKAKQGCEYKDIQQCNNVENIIQKGKFPDNEADVKDACEKLYAGGKCLKEKADQCLSPQNAQLATQLLLKEKEVLDKACGPEMAKFIDYAKTCFNKDGVLKGLKDIHTRYVDIVEAAYGFDKSTYKQSYCCSQLYSRDNIKDLNTKQCTAAQADYLDNLLKNSIGSLFHEQCGSPSSYAECSTKLTDVIRSRFDEIIKAPTAPTPKNKYAVPTLIEMAAALNL